MLGEAVLRLKLVVEGIEDGGELVPVDAKGVPAGFPDAFVPGEVGERTRGTGVGGDVWDGKVGEDVDVEVDGETADELKGGIALGP